MVIKNVQHRIIKDKGIKMPYKDKEKQREYQREYYRKNPEKFKEWGMRCRLKNPEKYNAYGPREWYKKYGREWYRKNHEKSKESTRRWVLKNQEKFRASQRRWQLENPLAWQAIGRRSTHKRRARKNDCPLVWSLKIENKIRQTYQDRCAYCGEGEASHFDHVIPLNPRYNQTPIGSHTVLNFAIACKSCNCSKHNRYLQEWFYSTYCLKKGINADSINPNVWRNLLLATQQEMIT